MNKVKLSSLKAVEYKTFGDIGVYNINHNKNIEIRKQIFNYVIEKLEESNKETLEIDGKETILELFPILTNLDCEDMTDEEIDDVLENPSEELLLATEEITRILTYDVLKVIERCVKTLEEKTNKVDRNDKVKLLAERKQQEEEKIKKEKVKLEYEELQKRIKELEAEM